MPHLIRMILARRTLTSPISNLVASRHLLLAGMPTPLVPCESNCIYTRMSSTNPSRPQAKPPSASSADATKGKMPNDLWAVVLTFMPFRDNVQFTSVCKSFLHDVAPLVKEIAVLDRRDMKIVLARRFRGVEEVNIGCLFRYPAMDRWEGEHLEFDYYQQSLDIPVEDFKIDSVVVSCTVPFISTFVSLKKVEIGGYFVDEISEITWENELFHHTYEDWVSCVGHGEPYKAENERNEELMRELEGSFCGAFQSGQISYKCKVIGVDSVCPKECRWSRKIGEKCSERRCYHCMRFCECFPLKDVTSNILYYNKRRRENAQACLEVLSRRPGSKKYLQSGQFIHNLCSQCHSEPLKAWFIKDALKELNLVPSMSREALLLRYEEDYACLRKKLYLQRYFDALVELGIPVDATDIPAKK